MLLGKRAILLGLVAAAVAVAVAPRKKAKPAVVPEIEHTAHERSSSALPPPIASSPRLLPPVVRRATSSHTAASLSGIVRDRFGAPAPGAHVKMFLLGRSGAYAFEQMTTTRADGTFTIAPLPGDYALMAELDKATSALLEPVSIATGEAVSEIELSIAGDGSVDGVIVDQAGNPVSGEVEVQVDGHTFSVSPNVKENAFTISGIPTQPFTLVAYSTDDGSRVERPMTHGEHGLVLRLGRPLGKVTLAFVDPRGAALVGLDVEQRGDNHMGLFSTDDEGHFAWQPSGRHSVERFSGDGKSSGPVTIDSDDREQLITVVMSPAATVHGRVVEARGVPHVGSVQILRQERSGQLDYVSRCSLAGGEYRFDSLDPGSYVVELSDADESFAGDGTRLELALGTAEQRELPELRLEGRNVRVRVVGPDGEPAANAAIQIVHRSEESIDDHNDLTGDDGTLSLEHIVGTVRIRALGDGSTMSAIMTASGRGDEEVTVQLHETGVLMGTTRTKGAAEVRCGGSLWHDVGDDGQYVLMCAVGDDLEIREGTATRRVPVDVSVEEETFVELPP